MKKFIKRILSLFIIPFLAAVMVNIYRDGFHLVPIIKAFLIVTVIAVLVTLLMDKLMKKE